MTSDMMLAVVVAAVAGLMRGFAGVGSGMLMAPFFVHIFGPIDTVAIVILIEIVATALLIPSVHGEIHWPTIGPIAAAATIAMPAGSWLLVSLDARVIQIFVSLLVILSALVLMTGWRYTGQRSLASRLGVGALSGLLMAVTSLGNPPVMVYLLSSQDGAATNRANFTGYFAVTLIALITLMTVSGLIGWPVIKTALTLLVGFLLTTFIGSKLFRKSNESFYRSVALAVLLCAGVYGLVR